MAAPKNNKFWELRSKHGRDKLFATPELFWEACCEYFQWIEDNPLIEIDYVGKDADRVEKPHTRPYTFQGLCLYLDVNTHYFIEFEESIKNKNDKISKDFSYILTRVRDIIYKQKFEGASCGFYNANLISRDLGLHDAQKIQQTTTNINYTSELTPEEIKRISDELEKEC